MLTLFCPKSKKKSDPLRAEDPKGSEFIFILFLHVLARKKLAKNYGLFRCKSSVIMTSVQNFFQILFLGSFPEGVIFASEFKLILILSRIENEVD